MESFSDLVIFCLLLYIINHIHQKEGFEIGSVLGHLQIF